MCLNWRAQEWALALVACLPAAERARARLQLELARMRARARRVGWPQIALAASLAIMVRLIRHSCSAPGSAHEQLQWLHPSRIQLCTACETHSKVLVRLAQQHP